MALLATSVVVDLVDVVVNIVVVVDIVVVVANVVVVVVNVVLALLVVTDHIIFFTLLLVATQTATSFIKYWYTVLEHSTS